MRLSTYERARRYRRRSGIRLALAVVAFLVWLGLTMLGWPWRWWAIGGVVALVAWGELDLWLTANRETFGDDDTDDDTDETDEVIP